MSEKINPELIKKCAEMAFPERKFHFVERGGINYVLPVEIVYLNPDYVFNPLTNDADAWALERALKKEGWSFYYSDTAAFPFNAIQRGIPVPISVGNESDTLLLLRCVAAMNSMEMYV